MRSGAGCLPYCVFNSRLEYKYSCLTVFLIVDLEYKYSCLTVITINLIVEFYKNMEF